MSYRGSVCFLSCTSNRVVQPGSWNKDVRALSAPPLEVHQQSIPRFLLTATAWTLHRNLKPARR